MQELAEPADNKIDLLLARLAEIDATLSHIVRELQLLRGALSKV